MGVGVNYFRGTGHRNEGRKDVVQSLENRNVCHVGVKMWILDGI